MDDEEGGMLLDPPDPLDLLIAHTESGAPQKQRPLDFVRAKFQEVKKENRRLRERVADLEQTLSIVQTAQEWSTGKGMSLEQKEKMREIKALLEQAKKAREEIQNFSGASRQALYEKLRVSKNALKKEREEKQEMKNRLLQAFDHGRTIKEQYRQLSQLRLAEQERWQEQLRETKDRHRRELRRLMGESVVNESDRQEQLSLFGEQVLETFTSLQRHLKEVREQTVDSVVAFEGGGEEEEEDLVEETLRFGGGPAAASATGDDGGLSAGEDDDF